MKLTFKKVDVFSALEIISWEYPAPYEIYTLHNSPLALVKLMEGRYYAAFDHTVLIGFFCFGSAAQLVTKTDHPLYKNKNYLDIGLGLHPNYCGKGLGANFLLAGLRYAQDQGWQQGFRLTVASSNLRAIKVYQRLQFKEQGKIFWDPALSAHFLVMTLDVLELTAQE